MRSEDGEPKSRGGSGINFGDPFFCTKKKKFHLENKAYLLNIKQRQSNQNLKQNYRLKLSPFSQIIALNEIHKSMWNYYVYK